MAMCGAKQAVAVLAVLLATATMARGGFGKPAESASCYVFGLGTKSGSTFSGGVQGQLATNGVVSGSSVYGVVHRCAHGVLAPNTTGVKSVAYYLDDRTHSGTPTGTKSGLTPFKLSTAGLAAGQHYLTVVITFKDSANYLPFVSTKSFRTPTTGTIPEYKQCGGAGGSCGGSGKACADAAWTGSSCRSGLTCRRQNKYYYQCLA